MEHVLEEVRTAASGPLVLRQHGVATALRALSQSGVMPVIVEDRGFGRRSEVVETTVYFCCAEALQNATKHAGPNASATVGLSHSDASVQFSVEDDGIGFDPHTAARGRGLDNMADRVATVGGSLAIDAAPARGTRVSGRLPADA